MNTGFPVIRGRRLRRTPALRALVAETTLRPADFENSVCPTPTTAAAPSRAVLTGPTGRG